MITTSSARDDRGLERFRSTLDELSESQLADVHELLPQWSPRVHDAAPVGIQLCRGGTRQRPYASGPPSSRPLARSCPAPRSEPALQSSPRWLFGLSGAGRGPCRPRHQGSREPARRPPATHPDSALHNAAHHPRTELPGMSACAWSARDVLRQAREPDVVCSSAWVSGPSQFVVPLPPGCGRAT